jgi:hypothetical protein
MKKQVAKKLLDLEGLASFERIPGVLDPELPEEANRETIHSTRLFYRIPSKPVAWWTRDSVRR